MKTIYETVTEELIMKEVEKSRQTIVSELDRAIEDVIKELTNKPFIKESEEDCRWHEALVERLLRLIILRRKSVEMESFKELQFEKIIEAITE